MQFTWVQMLCAFGAGIAIAIILQHLPRRRA